MLIAETSARVRIRVRRTRYRSSTSGGSSLKPKITKTTPIKATKFSSPVIKSQAKLGSRTQLFTQFAAGYLVTRYLLSVAPVYRGGFPVYGSYVSIPEKRALRLRSERVSLLDSNGSLCLGQSSQTLSFKEGIENSLIEVRTIVKYQGSLTDDKTFTGIKNTVPLKDVKDKTFTVTSRARYRVSVVENTRCTQVEKQVNGTMIQLYEYNPNAGIISIDLRLIFASIMVIGVFNCFK